MSYLGSEGYLLRQTLADFPSRLMDHPLLKRDLKVPEREVRDAFKGSMSFIELAKTPQSTWVGPWRKRAA